MAEKNKFYAIRKGYKRGIFNSWSECQQFVSGFKGAEFKSFKTKSEAENYILGINKALDSEDEKNTEDKYTEEKYTEVKYTEEKFAVDEYFEETKRAEIGEDNTEIECEKNIYHQVFLNDSTNFKYIPELGLNKVVKNQNIGFLCDKEKLLAYVDGSYNHSLLTYAFGCIYIINDEAFCDFGQGKNPEVAKLRNVSGEMLGAMTAVKFAINNTFKTIEICYDYKGIEEWATGGWKAKNDLTQKYRDFMQGCMNKINIKFTKVLAHSNVKYNELADKTAKHALLHGDI